MEALGKEVMRDEMFVFVCLSHKKKRTWTRKYLQDDHGFDEQEAEAAAEDVVEEAVMRLTADGIIDRNHYPLLEGETQEEKKQRFRELMGLNVAEDERDDRDESETGSIGESADDTQVWRRKIVVNDRSRPVRYGPVTVMRRMHRIGQCVDDVPHRTRTWITSGSGAFVSFSVAAANWPADSIKAGRMIHEDRKHQ